MKIKLNKTDKQFSLVVRSAAGWTCSCCGKQSPPDVDNGMMDNAHNVSRSVRIIRYDPRNTTCLCRGCHIRMTKDPHEHVSFFKSLSGENYEFCRDMKNDNMVKLTKNEEEWIYQHYRKEEKRIKELRADGFTGKIIVDIPRDLL